MYSRNHRQTCSAKCSMFCVFAMLSTFISFMTLWTKTKTSASSVEKKVNAVAVLFRESGAKLAECQMNDYNYTEAALLGFNETMNDVSLVNKSVDDLPISCATRVYNTSQHASSLVIEVSLFRSLLCQWNFIILISCLFFVFNLTKEKLHQCVTQLRLLICNFVRHGPPGPEVSGTGHITKFILQN